MIASYYKSRILTADSHAGCDISFYILCNTAAA